MKHIRKIFAWLIVIAGLHITEQFLFGLDELQEMRGFAGVFYGWFSDKDYATVTLVALLVLVLYSIVFAFLSGGRWWLLPMTVFAAIAVAEIHHVVKTIAHAAYFPGAVTAIPFSIAGLVLLRAVVTEYKAASQSREELAQ